LDRIAQIRRWLLESGSVYDNCGSMTNCGPAGYSRDLCAESEHDNRVLGVTAVALDSLRGLALGDGFGERWFHRGNREAVEMIKARQVPSESPWYWTDDTAMALTIVHMLHLHGEIRQDGLAEMFAATYQADPYRGYGYGMNVLLPRLAEDPGLWDVHAGALFEGQGSLGNGAAMRAAPLGAWFCHDLGMVREQARLAAEVTHAHPEGISGAVAVSVAAAMAAADRGASAPDPRVFLERAADEASGPVGDGIARAASVPPGTPAWMAADLLGNGQRVRASDTVPFAVWSAAHHLDDLPGALWTTAEGLGDVDTTCAITAGIVAARTGLAGVPPQWLDLCEPLPDWTNALASG
jgi:ADP-ribosylglycohydrolase